MDDLKEATPQEQRDAAESAFKAAGEPEKPAPAAAKADVVTAPVKADETSKPDEAVTAVVEDPWKDVPPVLRQTLENITTRLGEVDKLGHRFSSFEGRIGKVQKALDAAQAATKAGAPTPTQQDIAVASTTSEKWKRLKEEFPDWADAMDERIAAESAAIARRAQVVDVEAINQGAAKAASERLDALRVSILNEADELACVRRSHPKWKSKVKTDGFKVWLDVQAPEMQALADSRDADDAIRLLDAYDKHAEGEAERLKRQQRLESAIPAKGTPSQRTPTMSDRDAQEKGFAEA